MNCFYHARREITLICYASHKCQRKLCVECIQEQGLNHQTMLIETFQEKVKQKLKEHMLKDPNELNKCRTSFKSMLSETESMLKKIWEELSQSIKQIYDWIEQENKSYIDLINKYSNLAESSYTDLEKLVQIVYGKTLNDWYVEKNNILMELQKHKNCWNQEIKTYCQKLDKKIKDIIASINKLSQQEDLVQNQKEDLFGSLASLKNIDAKFFIVIIEMLKKEKPSDILYFLSKLDIQKLLNQYLDKSYNVNGVKNNIQHIVTVIKNIYDHDFNKKDYSTQKFRQTKQRLIGKIKKEANIIGFLKILVNLTSIDENLIQCGSNSLHLLVQMKVDLTQQSFQNIKIKNTSLNGGSFAECNFSCSKFNNVEISGINFNGAKLFHCEWKNFKIDQQYQQVYHDSGILSQCFSPDGSKLASGSWDNTICLRDIKTGKIISLLIGHNSPIYSVCFSPDSTILASGSQGGSIRLWDVKTGQEKAKLDGDCNCVYSVTFSPDGLTLASGSQDNCIRLWDIRKHQLKSKLDVHSNFVYLLKFNPDGTTLVTSNLNGNICLWDIRTRKKKFILNSYHDALFSVWFSPDDIRAFYSVCSSPDGTIAFGSYYGTICLWDAKTGLQKFQLYGHRSTVYSLCFTSDSKILASGSGSEDNSIHLWDVNTGKKKSELIRHNCTVYSLCFSRDGTALASVAVIILFAEKTKFQLFGHIGTVYQVCFSNDGSLLASGSDDETIRLWDVKSGQQKAKLDGHSGTVYSVRFSADGTSLISSSDDELICLWDLKTNEEIQSTDNRYKDLFTQLETPLLQHNILSVATNIPFLFISQSQIFQADEAQIVKGEFFNYEGIDLRPLLKSKGSYIEQ
ncbi:unnamed protein product [Paramecium primaurelia]|uniref:WD-40 repeat protein n=1 Tax=Paramecium primaurelia TaxID=5886 RepID=A0A8S1QL72_PARPR|nr:unnamed protein product [Paramecium primaurelia]